MAQILADIEKFSPLGYTLWSDGILLFQGCVCIPDDGNVKQEILNEARCCKNVPRPKATVLVEWYEERCSQLCFAMFSMPASESRTSETRRFISSVIS